MNRIANLGRNGTVSHPHARDPVAELIPALVQLCDLTARIAASKPQPIHVAIRHAGLAITLLVQPMGPEETTAPRLTPLERQVLGACGSVPMNAKRLAGKLGRPYNSRFREQLCDLCRCNLLVRTPDGYRLPDA